MLRDLVGSLDLSDRNPQTGESMTDCLGFQEPLDAALSRNPEEPRSVGLWRQSESLVLKGSHYGVFFCLSIDV